MYLQNCTLVSQNKKITKTKKNERKNIFIKLINNNYNNYYRI